MAPKCCLGGLKVTESGMWKLSLTISNSWWKIVEDYWWTSNMEQGASSSSLLGLIWASSGWIGGLWGREEPNVRRSRGIALGGIHGWVAKVEKEDTKTIENLKGEKRGIKRGEMRKRVFENYKYLHRLICKIAWRRNNVMIERHENWYNAIITNPITLHVIRLHGITGRGSISLRGLLG